MSSQAGTLQRIARLAPLAEIVARLDAAIVPVVPREADPAAAVGATLTADVVAPRAIPAAPAAQRDGWAVVSEQVSDAGPYAPVPLDPPPLWVEAGQAMPAGTDAVLPADAVVMTKAGAEAHAPAGADEGVTAVGAEIAKGAVLRRAGETLRPSDLVVFRAAGIERVSVRAPRVTVYPVTVAARTRDDTLSPLVARAVEAMGCVAQVAQASTLEAALTDRASDVIVTIGGTGTGKRDAAVKTLARIGKVEFHGLGIAPGETAALGLMNDRPVLMLPGRPDAALEALLIVGRALLARRAGRTAQELGASAQLTKKVTSTVGLADFVLVRRAGEGVEPLGSGILSLQSLAQADGWIVVPPESEGMAAGATVEMRALS
jgi:molybdopterin biosynthesis enzyme